MPIVSVLSTYHCPISRSPFTIARVVTGLFRIKVAMFSVLRWLLLLCWLAESAFAQAPYASNDDDLSPSLPSLIKLKSEVYSSAAKQRNGKLGVSVRSLSSAPSGAELGFGAEFLLKPASVLKVIVSAASLEQLGPDFRFKTVLSGSSINSNIIDRLTIKGSGDPSLTIEQLWLIARRVRKLALKRSIFFK